MRSAYFIIYEAGCVGLLNILETKKNETQMIQDIV